MQYLYKTMRSWLSLVVTSFGVWTVAYQVHGLWAKDANLVGYHSYSSDTGYLPLQGLVIIVLLAKLIQAVVIARTSYYQQLASYLAVGIIDNILWFSIFLNNYGIKAQGGFDVSIGYEYLFLFGLWSNVGLIVGLLSGYLIGRYKKYR